MVKLEEVKKGWIVIENDPENPTETPYKGTVLGTIPNGDSFVIRIRLHKESMKQKRISEMCPDKIMLCFPDSIDIVEDGRIQMPIIANNPFCNLYNDVWTWLADYCPKHEYSELDDIYCYLDGSRDKEELPEVYANMPDEELEEEYARRFPIMFGRALQNIGKALVDEDINMGITF